MNELRKEGRKGMNHVHAWDKGCTKFELLIPQLKENRQSDFVIQFVFKI